MSSGMSSDQIIKDEIVRILGTRVGNVKLRVFPQSSTEDQKLFEIGGLTFSHNGLSYGSCDAAWYVENETGEQIPVVALEGTDALNRGSAGNAQYQRFHHALGAVKNGIVGVYYLKSGNSVMQLDLLRMAYVASQNEDGHYIVTQDLAVVKNIFEHIDQHGLDSVETQELLAGLVNHQNEVWLTQRFTYYNSDWNVFAQKRSTIINDDHVIKHAARMVRNFTDGSQRAGHIAVGEMYLTKYLFLGKSLKYLFARMTREDVALLDQTKARDKEWSLLRNEPGVAIKTIDDIVNLPGAIRTRLLAIKEEPLKSGSVAEKVYNECLAEIFTGLQNGRFRLT